MRQKRDLTFVVYEPLQHVLHGLVVEGHEVPNKKKI